MPSLGEARVMMEATIVGRARVGALHPLPALRPRLGLQVYFDLDPVRDALHSGQKVEEYRLTDLSGDLRLKERGPAIGFLHWLGPRSDVRALPYPSESQLELACELDLHTLERLEAERDGGELRLSLLLQPRLEHVGGFLRATVDPITLAVPRDEWIRCLEGVGYGRYDIFELRLPLLYGDEVRRAADALRGAQQALTAGAYAESLSKVRFVLEALERVGGKGLAKLLPMTDPKRAEHYGALFSRLKQLSNIPHHGFGQQVAFLRAEARLAVRTAAGLLELVSALAQAAEEAD